tara:strand:+ start:995 stop:1582 length:588 start_codon:yes stop_codon:yes gene_type:complete
MNIPNIDTTVLTPAVSGYALSRIVFEIVFDNVFKLKPIKKWPASSWFLTIAHELLVIPYVNYYYNTNTLYLTTASYYIADFAWFWRVGSFQRLLFHHLASISVLMTGLILLPEEEKENLKGNILALTYGSACLNIRGVLNGTGFLRISDFWYGLFYLFSRIYAVMSLYNASKISILVSIPLLLHNLKIVKILFSR